ncbi:myotrophin-like [Panonychus citri]|uniref:myotrophin-like n=1 Tax=Panonychus citri TaxID=50023 RepID=UPI0023075F91|nr:myotrophin-like [Panonychus citri]
MSNDLVWSVKNGDIDQVKELIKKHKIDINEQIDGRTPVIYAADYGQKEILEYLIKIGANVNSTDKHGITALLAAIWEGHTDCVKLLLDSGADTKLKTPDGKSYLEVADKAEVKSLLEQRNLPSKLAELLIKGQEN